MSDETEDAAAPTAEELREAEEAFKELLEREEAEKQARRAAKRARRAARMQKIARFVPVAVRESAGIAGAVLVSYGFWTVYPAAGYVIGGVLLMVGAAFSARSVR